MGPARVPLLVLLLAPVSVLGDALTDLASTKRGLVYTPNQNTAQDNYVWRRDPSDLTWYYNYGSAPSTVFGNWTQAHFEFVPMLWGSPTSNTSFYTAVKDLVDGGTNISHVLTFNEPDGDLSTGGSAMYPSEAAQVWVDNIVPLQTDLGTALRVGLPACTGGYGGLPWLEQFLGNCSALISSGGDTKNCTYDFVPLHWYGNFEGMASHIGQYVAAFPNASIWVTEYGLDNSDLPSTQDFFNTSVNYLDRLAYVERYSYFGAFRRSQSNVGPNAAMLDNSGKLTDIGDWYLGRAATSLATSASSACWHEGLLLAWIVSVAIFLVS